MRMDVTMVTISHEQTTDIAEREVLLDRAFGPKRRRKTAERLRERRLPAEGLALSIRGCLAFAAENHVPPEKEDEGQDDQQKIP